MSLFWFHKLANVIPNHIIYPSIASNSPACLADPTSAWSEFPRSLDEYRDQLEGRSMIVQKCEVVKLEAIVRGYITGELVLANGWIFLLMYQVPPGPSTRSHKLCTVSLCLLDLSNRKNCLNLSSPLPRRLIRASTTRTSTRIKVSLRTDSFELIPSQGDCRSGHC